MSELRRVIHAEMWLKICQELIKDGEYLEAQAVLDHLIEGLKGLEENNDGCT